MQLSRESPELLRTYFKAIELENNVANKNSQKPPSRFPSCGVLLTGRKIIPPPSIVAETCCHSAAGIGFDTGANRGFGAEENDWLGAEAYIDPLC
jgi:hypothetical protein